MFGNAGAVVKAAQASLLLAFIQGWHIENAAAMRTAEEALKRLGSSDPGLRISLLTFRALITSSEGDVSGAARLLAEVRALPEAAGAPMSAFNDRMRTIFHIHSMEWEQAETNARRTAETYRTIGDLWTAAELGCLSRYALFCGHPAETIGHFPGAMQLAEKVGHHNALFTAMFLSAVLCIARGDLASAQRELEETRNFGDAHRIAWNFICGIQCGEVAFLRGNIHEAERWLSEHPEPRTFFFGWRDASLFALWAESNDDRAWKAWTDRRWKLPRSGQLNSVGEWMALEKSVVGLASMGKKEEAAALRPLTEDLIRTEPWVGFSLLPFRTVAGIAAACAGDWSAAEAHHLIAIKQTDTAPYRVSQPIAREWYAMMLLERGEKAKARGLLAAGLSMYESMGMPFHAKRAGERLALS